MSIVVLLSDATASVADYLERDQEQIIAHRLVRSGDDLMVGDFSALAQVPATVLVVDLDAGPAEIILAGVKQYRLIRDSVRIIALAQGRTPGDFVASSLVNLGIYDILAPGANATPADMATAVAAVLRDDPAGYADAARWQTQTEGQPNKSSWFGLGSKTKPALKPAEVPIEAPVAAPEPAPVEPAVSTRPEASAIPLEPQHAERRTEAGLAPGSLERAAKAGQVAVRGAGQAVVTTARTANLVIQSVLWAVLTLGPTLLAVWIIAGLLTLGGADLPDWLFGDRAAHYLQLFGSAVRRLRGEE